MALGVGVEPGQHLALEQQRDHRQQHRDRDRIADQLADALVQRPVMLERERGQHGGRQGADAEALHDVPVHRAAQAVGEGAGALGDRGERQVGADRDRRRHPEQQRQQRCHERTAAHAGHADQQANRESRTHICQQHAHPP
jgi:hypothetical protein